MKKYFKAGALICLLFLSACTPIKALWQLQSGIPTIIEEYQFDEPEIWTVTGEAEFIDNTVRLTANDGSTSTLTRQVKLPAGVNTISIDFRFTEPLNNNKINKVGTFKVYVNGTPALQSVATTLNIDQKRSELVSFRPAEKGSSVSLIFSISAGVGESTDVVIEKYGFYK